MVQETNLCTEISEGRGLNVAAFYMFILYKVNIYFK